MKKVSKVAVAVTAGAILMGGATAASAALSYPSGGIWEQGIRDGRTVYSEYYHKSKAHSATAQNALRKETSRESPNRWAKASIEKTLWGNKTFYNVY